MAFGALSQARKGFGLALHENLDSGTSGFDLLLTA